ncbi:MAG: toxin [Verrucomicrobiales bacterium]|nr:toxin [Verrucomicrobiales bacterium]
MTAQAADLAIALPTHLLDVNVLIAAITETHALHTRAFAWIADKQVMLCPLTELGYLRVSTHPKILNVSMADARKALEQFVKEHKVARIADDVPALDTKPKKSEEVTDQYLAALAAKHRLRLATFDANIKHAAVDVIQ